MFKENPESFFFSDFSENVTFTYTLRGSVGYWPVAAAFLVNLLLPPYKSAELEIVVFEIRNLVTPPLCARGQMTHTWINDAHVDK